MAQRAEGVRLEVVPSGALDGPARAEIVALCERAYGEDFSWLFTLMPVAVHVLARDGAGTLLSHAEWVGRGLQPAGHPVLRTAYVESVATLPAHQGRGLASAVLRRLVEEVAADPQWELSALSPSEAAFYARLGWERWRGPLAIRRGGALEPSPPTEEVMVFRLPRTPPTLDTTALLTAEWREGEVW